MIVVAIVGMCGTGKSVATSEFVANGWKDVYFGSVLLDAVRERGWEITPENETIVRESLRKEFGQAAIAVKLLPRIIKLLNDSNVVIDGLYTWAEYKFLKEKLKDRLQILSIVSDREQRYKRLVNRSVRPLTYQEASARDYSEIEILEKGGPIAIADKYIMNNDTEDKLRINVNSYIESIKGMLDC